MERGREGEGEEERELVGGEGWVHSLGIFPNFRPNFAEENNIAEEV